METRAFAIQSTCSTTELYPQPEIAHSVGEDFLKHMSCEEGFRKKILDIRGEWIQS